MVVVVSPPPRLQSLSQPEEKNLSSSPLPFFDIPPQQINQSLHYYDQDVVRELSIPPEQLSSGPRRYQFVNGSTPQTAETSSFPFSQHVSSLNSHSTRPPVIFTSQHGLPSSLPPPPRTTFVAETPITTPQESSSDLVRILDSILRGSYNNMLASTPDTNVMGVEAPAVENNTEVAIDYDFLDDILQPDVCEENFLTSPLLDQTPETPFIDTPYDENFCSPFLDDGSYAFDSMPPPFGSIVPQAKEETCVLPTVTITPVPPPPPAHDSYGSPQYITSPLLDPASFYDASKAEPITPALPSLDDALYKIPETPSLSPSLLLTPARPPMQLPSSSSSSIPKSSRPTKALPTGIRRGITPASLVPIDAPTQSRNYTAPSATSRKLVPAAFKAKKRGRSEAADNGGVEDEEEGEDSVDPSTMSAIENKRRQNTIAARRSRMRKLEHTRELEESLAAVTQDRDMWMARAYEAENKLRVHGIS